MMVLVLLAFILGWLFNFIMNIILNRGIGDPTSPQDVKTLAFEASLMDQDKVVNRTVNTSGQDLVQGNMITTQTRKEMESRDQGDGNAVREKITKGSIVDGGNLPRRRHHLLSVDTNINEKSDAFIKSQLEKMGMH